MERARVPCGHWSSAPGPASGACGIAAGEKHAQWALPKAGDWALIEQDKAMLELGSEWAQEYFVDQSVGDWGVRTFHRKIDFARGLLPPSAPSFNLWVMSYFLNEATEPPRKLAEMLITAWEKHLDEEGVVILVEPALKLQSRKLLELRRELLARARAPGRALAANPNAVPGPSSLRRARGPRRLVPRGSELVAPAVLPRDRQDGWARPQDAALQLSGDHAKQAHARGAFATRWPASAPVERLVSPAHYEGKEQEFFICGQEGKRRARYRAKGEDDPAHELERGDILGGAEARGDVHSARVERIKTVL